jgi:hypothetical protein
MEVVGRFTANKEGEEYEIAPNTPAWLPTRMECTQFTSEVRNQLKWLREAIMISVHIISKIFQNIHYVTTLKLLWKASI